MNPTRRILGIDPGLNHTGFGVIDAVGDRLVLVSAGCIHVPRGELSERLGIIHRELAKIIEQTHPQAAAAEIVFVNVNPRSTLLLGQARGAALACASVHDLCVSEFSATAIKQSVVGTGRATKLQVQEMVMRLLNLSEHPQADAADALACAITCANSQRLGEIERQGAVLSKTGIKSMRSTRHKRAAWEQLVKLRTEK